MAKTVAELSAQFETLQAQFDEQQQTYDQALERAEFPMGVHDRLALVMAGVGVVSKDHENPQHHYTFRSIDDVVNQLQPALISAGVTLSSEVVETATELYTTTSGTKMRWAMVHMRYRFHGPQGDYQVAEGVGEAADASDKAHMKAMQQAYKYALLQVLVIPTGEADADAESPEGAGNGAEASDFTNWAKGKVVKLVPDTEAAQELWGQAWAKALPAVEVGQPLGEDQALSLYAAAKQLNDEAQQALQGEDE